MKNIPASIKARLQNGAREKGIPLNVLLEEFALARLFARLSESQYRRQFILKGAQLFTLWAGSPHRPTRDADFLSFGDPGVETLESIFDEICVRKTEPSDGLEWLPAKAAPIREDNLYGGVRLKLWAILGTIRIPIQVDVGFGDSITPAAQEAEWKMPLDFPPADLLVYCAETSVAEKIHAAVELGTTNSRMKDFYDLLWLSQNRKFEGEILQAAVAATFAKRGTVLPNVSPIAFTERFSSMEAKQKQWAAFLRKGKLEPLPFDEVIRNVAIFADPVVKSDVDGMIWIPAKGWV